jgi:hypothetical protein
MNIFSFAEEYENFFSSVVISQFMSSIFVICLSCLQLTKVSSTSISHLYVSILHIFQVTTPKS